MRHVTDVRIHREGTENDPKADVVVEVRFSDGAYVTLGRERLSSNFSSGWSVEKYMQPDSASCTSVSAGYCPIHGDCICKDGDDKNDEMCPLHSATSMHGEI